MKMDERQLILNNAMIYKADNEQLSQENRQLNDRLDDLEFEYKRILDDNQLLRETNKIYA